MDSRIDKAGLERKIRRGLRAQLQQLGFTTSDGRVMPPSTNGKASLREMHRVQREERLKAEKRFTDARIGDVLPYFASGSEVVPDAISPSIELVSSGTKQADIFRLASLTWSVPVSRGYGRRMRFLIWDSANGRLMGLLALADPVFNLKARDEAIRWDVTDRKRRLVNVMDAYILGALPPYSRLLSGKLMACLVRTREIRDHFSRRYAKAEGIISGETKRPSLVMVTTSSALGRSSVYNRLKLGGVRYFEPIGYTAGWGHFHISEDLFHLMREYLAVVEHPYASGHRFGQGPNWRLRTIRAAVTMLGMDANMLRHGIARQAFICRLADNADAVLRGEAARPRYSSLLSVPEVSSLALERWIVPRAERCPDFRSWRREDIVGLLDPSAD